MLTGRSLARSQPSYSQGSESKSDPVPALHIHILSILRFAVSFDTPVLSFQENAFPGPH
jgi:hypothetical protein